MIPSRFSHRCLLLLLSTCFTQGCNKTADPSTAPVALSLPDGNARDLGQVDEGSAVETVFRIQNPLPTPVTFDPHVATSCGCTLGVLSHTKLSPGETAELKIGLSVGGRPETTQRVVATIVPTSPPGLEPIRFGLMYISRRHWSLTPEQLVVAGSPGEEKTLRFHVNAASEKLPIRILQVQCDIPGVVISGAEPALLASGREMNLQFRVPELSSARQFGLRVQTSDSSVPERSAVISLTPLPYVRVIPPVIVLNPAPDDRKIMTAAATVRPSVSGVTVEKVEVDSSELHVELDRASALKDDNDGVGDHWIVRVQGSASLIGSSSGKVTLILQRNGHELRTNVPYLIRPERK